MITDREKYESSGVLVALYDEIARLEQRLVELEVRAAAQSGQRVRRTFVQRMKGRK